MSVRLRSYCLLFLLWLISSFLVSNLAAGNCKICTGEDLENLIQSRQIKSVEETLSALQEHDRHLLGNFALVYKSFGLQQATKRYPRVILFSGDAKFLMAIEGAISQQRRGQTIEMIWWDSDQYLFRFGVIDFLKSSNLNKDTTPCKTCHHQKLRPNWFTYPHWPGVLSGAFKRAHYFYTNERRYDALDDILKSYEREIYKNIQDNWLDPQARYRWLAKYAPDLAQLSDANNELGNSLIRLNHLRIAVDLMQVGKDRFDIPTGLLHDFVLNQSEVYEMIINPKEKLPAKQKAFADKIAAYRNGLTQIIFHPEALGEARWKNGAPLSEACKVDTLPGIALFDEDRTGYIANIHMIADYYDISSDHWSLAPIIDPQTGKISFGSNAYTAGAVNWNHFASSFMQEFCEDPNGSINRVNCRWVERAMDR